MKKKQMMMAMGVWLVISASFVASFGFSVWYMMTSVIPEALAARELPTLPQKKVVEKSVPPDVAARESIEAIKANPIGGPDRENLTKVAKELELWQKDLEDKQVKLLEIDQALLEREKLVTAEREALERQRLKLVGLKNDLEALTIKIDDNELTNYEQLADLYSSMKIDQATRMMRELPDEQILRMLLIMKNTRKAKMLDTWLKLFPDDIKRLSRITDDMRRIVREQKEAEGQNQKAEKAKTE